MSVTKNDKDYNLLSSDQRNANTYYNENMNLIASDILSLESAVGAGSTTKYVTTPLGFIGALDTSKANVTFGGSPSANPFYGQTINKVVVQADIDISNLSSTHFGGGADEYYIIPSDDIVEISSEGNRRVTCTNFGIEISVALPANDDRVLSMENITYVNLGNTLTTIAVNQVQEKGIQNNVTYERLKGSIKTPANFSSTSGLDGNYSFNNLFIDGFDDGFTVLDGLFNFNNIEFKMYSTDIANTNTLMDNVYNGSNISLIYDYDETKADLSIIMFNIGALISNIAVFNCSISMIASLFLIYSSNFYFDLNSDLTNNIGNCSNGHITDSRSAGTNYLISTVTNISNITVSGSTATWKVFSGTCSNCTAVDGTDNVGGLDNSWNNNLVTTTGTTATIAINDLKNLGDTTSNAITYTLPAIADAYEGEIYLIKDSGGNANTNNITINPAGAETIDGAASYTISSDYGKIGLLSDGTNWLIAHT